MIEMTCKCGKTAVKFKHLTRASFPDGDWIQPCCPKEAPKPQPVEITVPKVEVMEEQPRPPKRRNRGRKKED